MRNNSIFTQNPNSRHPFYFFNNKNLRSEMKLTAFFISTYAYLI